MWIFCNNAFVSIVQDQRDPARLMVRARAKGDISRFLNGSVEEIRTVDADYRYRFSASRDLVAKTLAKHVEDLSYPNFKSSVLAADRERAYHDIWWIMFDFQKRREEALEPIPSAPAPKKPRKARRRKNG